LPLPCFYPFETEYIRANILQVHVHIESTVRRTLKMFESELHADGINMTFVVDDSYKDASLETVYCDPVRLTQIFINILTNVSLPRSRSFTFIY
jgi:signal transduction histidine kinase